MSQSILQIFTRTPLHIGAGASVGDIDQPVIRERHTGFLVIPGSGTKGAIADYFLEKDPTSGALVLAKGVKDTFQRTGVGRLILGDELDETTALNNGRKYTGRGGIAFIEGRILAFPVRSGKGCFAWVTCPFVLQRWARDTGRPPFDLHDPQPDEVCAGSDLCDRGEALFEDYVLKQKERDKEPVGLDDTTMRALQGAHDDALWQKFHPSRIALVHDHVFAVLVRTTCEVPQHVSMNDETGAAADGKLFNQENCPSETLFYSVLSELRSGALDALKEKSSEMKVLQLGADATTGLGFCTTRIV